VFQRSRKEVDRYYFYMNCNLPCYVLLLPNANVFIIVWNDFYLHKFRVSCSSWLFCCSPERPHII